MKTAESFNANCNCTYILFRIHYSHSPSLHKCCVRRNFRQVEFNVSRNFPAFTSVFLISFAGKTKFYQLFLRHLVYGVTPSTRVCLHIRVLHLFPTGYKICFHNLFIFAPAGKTLREVEFTSVEYNVRGGVTVLCTGVLISP